VIEITAVGFLDDSLRGTWRMNPHEIAYRCRRGHHLESYSAARCL